MRVLRQFVGKLLLSLLVLALILLGCEFTLRVRQKSRVSAGVHARIHDFFYFDKDVCFRIQPGAQGLHRPYEGEDDMLVRVNAAGNQVVADALTAWLREQWNRPG